MSHYKPYPAYKDSCVEWIGDVPEHWEVKSFKRVASIRNGQDYKHVEATEGDFPVIGSGGEFARASAFLFNGESVLLGRKGTIDKPLYMNGPFWAVDTMFFTEIAPTAHAKYIYYTALNIPFGMYSTNTALPSMTQEALSNHIIAVPKLNEQSQIAAALDRETTRIDALIIKKTRFIELLKEKRTALITHAVTKGLNPNVKMKDSGVEWIGEVPEHWQVAGIKRIVSIPITDGPHETPAFYDHGVPFASAEAVSTGRIDFQKIRGFISHEDHSRFSKKYLPSKGDIFMVKSGATTGVTAIVEDDREFNIWSPLAVIRCNRKKAQPEYVLSYLRSRHFLDGVALNWSYGTQQNIGMGVLENMAIPLPPLHEQEVIAAFLDRENTRIDTLTEKTQRSINLLKERRSAFITAAVTGQIDLREAI